MRNHPDHVEPSLSATAVVAAMPEGEWLTEEQISALPAAAAVLAKTSRKLRSALGEARRRGWVIRDPAGPVLTWTKTPKGVAHTSEGIVRND